MSDTKPPDEPSAESLRPDEMSPRPDKVFPRPDDAALHPDEAGSPTPPRRGQRPTDAQRAPRMIDLRLLAPATATWAASW